LSLNRLLARNKGGDIVGRSQLDILILSLVCQANFIPISRMAGVCFLFEPLVYFLLSLLVLLSIFLTIKAKKFLKPFALLTAIFFCYLIFNFRSYLIESKKLAQLHRVGFYYLTNYPDCDSCVLELMEDKTYVVRAKDKVVEKSNWRFEAGCDFWITYLDNDRKQLGSGSYAYEVSELKY
jgi:hypothetical protein